MFEEVVDTSCLHVSLLGFRGTATHKDLVQQHQVPQVAAASPFPFPFPFPPVPVPVPRSCPFPSRIPNFTSKFSTVDVRTCGSTQSGKARVLNMSMCIPLPTQVHCKSELCTLLVMERNKTSHLPQSSHTYVLPAAYLNYQGP